jgi:hypothetical protein
MTIVLFAAVLGACGPERSTFARYPTAATAFDRAGSDPKALAVADKVLAAAGGGERWAKARQARWTELVTADGKLQLTYLQAWDRWNGRHQGRLHHDKPREPGSTEPPNAGDVVVMRKLYEEGGRAFGDTGKALQPIATADTEREVIVARQRWELDTVVLFMAFLLEEPGAKLEYVGEPPVEAGKPVVDDIKVTFDLRDPTRPSTYHVLVNRDTSLPDRVDIVAKGQPDNHRLAYAVSDWTEVGGLKIPTKAQNIGTNGETITFKDISFGEPDDTLYVPSTAP